MCNLSEVDFSMGIFSIMFQLLTFLHDMVRIFFIIFFLDFFALLLLCFVYRLARQHQEDSIPQSVEF